MRNQEASSHSLQRGNPIESHLIENRTFKPAKGFSKRSYISSFERYQDLYRKSIKNPESFWSQQASELLVWHKKWNSVLKWKEPFAKWFAGGKLNVSENCLDRHLTGLRKRAVPPSSIGLSSESQSSPPSAYTNETDSWR